ncbi:MAG: branched-chain amino acid ABC transporter permease [Deltaproteobacteria bacterium]|nr:branched-chain amino acid ABC transporter permease [Deltaproteobacteria bacterium]
MSRMTSSISGSSIASAAVVVCAFFFPFYTEDAFVLSLLIPGMIWAAGCMGWTTIVRTGQFSMGQAGFMTIGGYTSALLAIHFQLPFWVTFFVAGAAAAIIAFLLGTIVLRLGGIFFAIVTLSFAEVIRVFATNLTITKGSYGLIPPPPTLDIGSWSVNFAVTKVPYYYVSLLFLILAAIVFWRIDSSRLGRIFRSVSSNDRLSEHLGMHLMKYRVMAFVVAGFFTGMAGALYCHYLFFMGPTLFGLWESIMILIMCTVGGVRSAVAGPIIGALLLSISGDYLSTLVKGAKPLAFGLLVVFVVFFLPGGVIDVKRPIQRLFSREKKNAEGLQPSA